MRKSNGFTLSDEIEWLDIPTVIEPEDLIHKDAPLDVEKIKVSMDQFGNLSSIVVDADNRIVDGVRRFRAAKRAGETRIPARRLKDVTPTEAKAIRLTLNQLQTISRFDQKVVKNDLADLIGQDFDVLGLGFDSAEIEALLGSPTDPNDALDSIPATSNEPAAEPGDIFDLGKHVIACGNSLDPELSSKVMNDCVAAACITDPPYNQKIDHISNRGRTQNENFAMGAGEMSPQEFQQFLHDYMSAADRFVKPGGYQFGFMDWAHMHLLVGAANEVGLEHKNTCVWVKSNAGNGGLYRSQHEFIGVFRKKGGKPTNNVKLGKYGRNRSNIWDYRGANSFGGTRDQDLKDHPTVKPVALLESAIRDVTNRNEIVLDPFGGSGSTMLAAEHCGRQSRLIEIEPKYVEVTLRRMRDAFGIEAIHRETGLTLEQLRAKRLAQH